MGSIILYSTILRQLDIATNGVVTAHNMLAMRVTKRNNLKNLRRILLAENEDISSTHMDTPGQCYNMLCTQLGKITLLGTSYPLIALLNVVELLKYWHTRIVRRPQDHLPPRQQQTQGTREDTRHRSFIKGDHTVAALPPSPTFGHQKCQQ